MSTITTFGPLFDLASADWVFTPLPPLRGGGQPPRVASRAISVVANFYTQAGAASGDIYAGILNYSPAMSYYILSERIPRLVEVPATFAGGVQFDDENTGLQTANLVIAAGLLGYHATIALAGSAAESFTPIPPSGRAGTFTSDPLLNITFDAGPYTVAIFNYTFFMTYIPYSDARRSPNRA